MALLVLRDYQQQSLDKLMSYLRRVIYQGVKVPFEYETDRPYLDAPHMETMPYVCLRVPTGGGKTFMACHAVAIAARELIQSDHPVCLWLAPSNAIVNQTRDALKNRAHPYRQALDAAFSSRVCVMDLSEALCIKQSDLDGAACIIVTTLQALRVEETEGRKVYESNGNLQPHFSDLHPMILETVKKDGVVVYSLANVLSIRHPIVIMDEAHNARTPLSFDTLNRFNPACIIEFTATPETHHDPAHGSFASNILHHVSARQLKAAEMIKLPIKLQTHPDWRQIVSDAVQAQRNLERLALEEQPKTGEYLRPIVLLQAQSRSGDIPVDALKQSLINDFRIPEDQIAIATGETRGIEDINLFEPSCGIRFIITVRALAEGWDCSFAYILCSVSEISTPRSVEQILGRILRLPNARWKNHPELNCAYAFAASPNFIHTAKTLADALIDGAGFQELEACDLIVQGQSPSLWDHGLVAETSETLQGVPNLKNLPPDLAPRVSFDPKTSTLTVKGPIYESQIPAMKAVCTNLLDLPAIERIIQRNSGTVSSRPPVAFVEPLKVPQLAIRVENQLELFEDQFLEMPWNLSECDPALSESEFPSEYESGASGSIDVTKNGHVEMTDFVRTLHRQLDLLEEETGWTLPELTVWLDRKIPHPDIPQSQSGLYIRNVLAALMERRNLQIEHLARHKFPLSRAIEEKIDSLRRIHRRSSFDALLFNPETPFEVGPDLCLTYDENAYAPNWYYEGSYRFSKHLYKQIGELKSDGEEFECAVQLDSSEQVAVWIRNLDRRPESSFWLQTSTDRFYPDFVARMTDGRILVVEYKGADRWSNDDSKEKRAIGDLWAARSIGRCIFVMPKGPDWSAIFSAIRR